MKLELTNVHGQGNQKEEYVALKATDDCDLSSYIVADSAYTAANTISNTFRHVFWFYGKKIKKGDFVFLYTKKGTDDSFENNANTKTYRFYWGSDHAIWNDTGDAAILFELSTWAVKRAK